MYIFGFKVHVLIDCLTGLPIARRVTKEGFGESRAARYFVGAAARLSLSVRMFLSDAGYDTFALYSEHCGEHWKARPHAMQKNFHC